MPSPKPVAYSDMAVRNVFPSRGKVWCRWEEDFLLDWLEDFGLQECARQLGRTPASVALRCAWLGIRKPKPKDAAGTPAPKAEAKPEAQTPEKAPERPADAKEAPSIGNHKGKAKAEPPAPAESESGILGMVEPAAEAPARESLDGMSRLDILKAFARGEAVGGIRA